MLLALPVYRLVRRTSEERGTDGKIVKGSVELFRARLKKGLGTRKKNGVGKKKVDPTIMKREYASRKKRKEGPGSW